MCVTRGEGRETKKDKERTNSRETDKTNGRQPDVPEGRRVRVLQRPSAGTYNLRADPWHEGQGGFVLRRQRHDKVRYRGLWEAGAHRGLGYVGAEIAQSRRKDRGVFWLRGTKNLASGQ